jgi:flagellin
LTQSAIQLAINAQSGTTGVIASTDATGKLVLTAADGSNITVTDNAALNGSFAATIAGTTYGTVSLSATTGIVVGGTAPANAGLLAGSASLTTTGLSGQDVLTAADANKTISSVDAALATVSAFQAQLGAIQNRFTAAVQNLTSTSQNLTQSRSPIPDANFAQETANLTQSQVLQQAGIAVLAQANSEPQLILKLLP